MAGLTLLAPSFSLVRVPEPLRFPARSRTGPQPAQPWGPRALEEVKHDQSPSPKGSARPRVVWAPLRNERLLRHTGGTVMARWYVRHPGAAAVGPIDSAELQAAWNRREIPPGAVVCAEGFSQWVPFHTVAELVGAPASSLVSARMPS